MRKLAKEGFLDGMGFNSVKPIIATKLSPEKIAEYEKIPDLIQKLDEWILVPDYRLLPHLLRLVEIVNNVEHIGFPLKLYRGFDPKSPTQNTMGLSTKGLLSSKVKEYRVGDTVTYSNLQQPLSFTTDLGIAKEFGPTVVEIDASKKDNFLLLSDELMYVVSKVRQIAPETQKEVIFLPPISIRYKVIEKR